MALSDNYARRVKDLGREVRTALVAECAARVAPVYENYPVGFSCTEVARSVTIAWDHACGTPFDPSELERCQTKVTQLVDYYYDDGLEVLAEATTVVLRAIECLRGDDKASLRATGRAMVSALGTAQAAEAMANVGWLTKPRTKRARVEKTIERTVALAEEEAWHARAIAIAKGWKQPVARTMFAAAGASPPEWFTDWLKRSSR